MFNERLKEERERLDMSQTNFGEACGVKKQAQFNYEKGDRKPDSTYLEKACEMGVDVSYLLTGIRTTNNELTVLDKIVSAKNTAVASGNTDGADNLLQAAQDWQGDIIKRAENAKARADILREANLMLCGLDDSGFEQAIEAISDIYFQTKLKVAKSS